MMQSALGLSGAQPAPPTVNFHTVPPMPDPTPIPSPPETPPGEPGPDVVPPIDPQPEIDPTPAPGPDIVPPSVPPGQTPVARSGYRGYPLAWCVL